MSSLSASSRGGRTRTSSRANGRLDCPITSANRRAHTSGRRVAAFDRRVRPSSVLQKAERASCKLVRDPAAGLKRLVIQPFWRSGPPRARGLWRVRIALRASLLKFTNAAANSDLKHPFGRIGLNKSPADVTRSDVQITCTADKFQTRKAPTARNQNSPS